MEEVPQDRNWTSAFWLALLALVFTTGAMFAAYRSLTVLTFALAAASALTSVLVELTSKEGQRKERLALQALGSVALVVGVTAFSLGAVLLPSIAVAIIVGVTLIEMQRRPWPDTRP